MDRDGALVNGDRDVDCKALSVHLGKLGYISILELNEIVCNYARTLFTKLPWPIPARILSNAAVSASHSWGELAVHLPIGSVGLFQTMEITANHNEFNEFCRGRQVPFVVVDKPANAQLGTINVVFLQLQRLRDTKFWPMGPEDLSEDMPRKNRFAAVELWLDPNEPVKILFHSKQRKPSAVCAGSDASYSLPILLFMDTTDSSVGAVWSMLSQTYPGTGKRGRWNPHIEPHLQQIYAHRLAFHHPP